MFLFFFFCIDSRSIRQTRFCTFGIASEKARKAAPSKQRAGPKTRRGKKAREAFRTTRRNHRKAGVTRKAATTRGAAPLFTACKVANKTQFASSNFAESRRARGSTAPISRVCKNYSKLLQNNAQNCPMVSSISSFFERILMNMFQINHSFS